MSRRGAEKETETETERQRIPSGMCTVSVEPDAGLELSTTSL